MLYLGLMDIVKLFACIIFCLGAGSIGDLFLAGSLDTWYAALRKPAFNPPSWVFGPVWTILYILMGVSVFLVWNKGFGYPGVRIAIILFIIQLVLNALWTPAFFGARSPLLGLIVILLLWLAILATMVTFGRISIISSVILLPYIMWVSFAVVLNAALFYLNR